MGCSNVPLKIFSCGPDDAEIITKRPQSDVAAVTQKAAHYFRLMIVIDVPTTPTARLRRCADGTPTTLRGKYRVILGDRDAITFYVSTAVSAEVSQPRRLR
jgi:hypothetical protein